MGLESWGRKRNAEMERYGGGFVIMGQWNSIFLIPCLDGGSIWCLKVERDKKFIFIFYNLTFNQLLILFSRFLFCHCHII